MDTTETSNYELNKILDLLPSSEIALTPEDLYRYWSEHFAKIQQGLFPELLNLYIHIPFCEQKCYMCNYYSTPLRSSGEIDDYLQYLADYIAFYQKLLACRTFTNFYVGGGTPSILTLPQLKRFFTLIDTAFDISEKGECTFECSPYSMDEKKIKMVADRGFNRISFGVQSISSSILAAHNRGYQNKEIVDRFIDNLKKHNFAYENADVLFGLQGQHAKDVLNSLAFLMKRGIKQITLYRINVTPIDEQREHALTLFSKELYPCLRELADRYEYFFTFFSYGQHSFSFHHKNSNIPKTRYDDLPRLPYSLFGIGPNVRSHIYARASYTNVVPLNKDGNIDQSHFNQSFFRFDPKIICANGKEVDISYELLRMLSIHLMRGNVIDPTVIRNDYGNRIADYLLAFMRYAGYNTAPGQVTIGKTNEEKWQFLKNVLDFTRMKR